MTRLATGWAIFQGLLIEALPFLLLGVTIAGLARWLVPQSTWVRRLPRHPLLAPLVGALLGFALPACECGNVPVARRLLASGAPLGTGFGFLFAAPVLNPIVLASTWAAFPDKTWLLWARPAGAFLIALSLSALLGLLPEAKLLETALLEERRMSQPLSSVGLLERRGGVLGSAPASPEQRVDTPGVSPRLLIQHSTKEFLGLLTLLVLGSALAAVVQTWLPRSWLLALVVHDVVGDCADAPGFGGVGLLERRCFPSAWICCSGHARGSVGLPVAGACGGSQARWVVHGVADAASHCDHRGISVTDGAVDRSVGESPSAVMS